MRLIISMLFALMFVAGCGGGEAGGETTSIPLATGGVVGTEVEEECSVPEKDFVAEHDGSALVCIDLRVELMEITDDLSEDFTFVADGTHARRVDRERLTKVCLTIASDTDPSSRVSYEPGEFPLRAASGCAFPDFTTKFPTVERDEPAPKTAASEDEIRQSCNAHGYYR